MARGESTQRSDLNPETLIGRLQARGVAQLRGAAAIWVALDGSDLRKPHAREMAHLQPVKALDGRGWAPGYRTLNALGIGGDGRRGLLYHRLFSSQAPDFLSESHEIQLALGAVGGALTPLGVPVSWLLDTQFDDIAVWATIWQQGQHLVCRLKHHDRWVETVDGAPVQLATHAGACRELARVETELVVKKRGQRREKLQPVTARIAAVELVVPYREDVRARPDGAAHRQRAWLVLVELANVASEPWWLITDQPVATAEQARQVFQMYRMRWAVEDSFKVGKQCLGWEDVQLLDYEAVRLLVALGWVAAGFLYELGMSLEWPEVRLLVRLGGGETRPNRPPGKQVLTRGLRRLLDVFVVETVLAAEIREHGQLPPRIAALLGRPPTG
jgi:hypothetical protein